MNTVEQLTIYEIPAENIAGLLHKIGKLSKKSEKILGKPIKLTMMGEIHKPITVLRGAKIVPLLDDEGKPTFDVFFKVSIEAETPRIAGWTFVATIDHSAKIGNIIRMVPNTVAGVPEKYRTAKPDCDHCRKLRGRRDTYLLRNDATGQFKQIGRQCIRDFIGHDVENVVAMAEVLGNTIPGASDGDSDWSGGMVDRRYISPRTFLAHVSATMRKFGWISRKDAGIIAEATCEIAHRNMFPPKSPSFKRLPLTEQDFATADASLAWGKIINARNEYQHNLKVIASEPLVEYRSIGMLARMVPDFMRIKQMEFKLANESKVSTSKLMGTKGERLRNIDAVIFDYRPYVSKSTGFTKYLYKFMTPDGSILLWFGSVAVKGIGVAAAAKRAKVRIVAGTVQDHKVNNGVNETILGRCKVVLA